MSNTHDAVLMISFGGPETMDEVRPFLAEVTRGRPIPPSRLEEVVGHYELIGGRSPITELTNRQARALEEELIQRGSELPVYVGMRNWRPRLSETVSRMAQAGARRAVGVIMSTHRCDASWERYQRDVSEALRATAVPLVVDYTEPVFDHPGFIEATAELVEPCLRQVAASERAATVLLFSAHSIPAPMAEASGYADQVERSARLVSDRLGHETWTLGYQSRSGRPTDPWLGPELLEVIRQLACEGVRHVVIVPVGFVCDHVEILYDLDIEAATVAREVGINLLRAGTVIDHPKFIGALAEAVTRCWS